MIQIIEVLDKMGCQIKGKVTLNACIINHEKECGDVAFLQDI